MGPHRIIVVDDDKNMLNALRRVLMAENRDVELFSDPDEALRRAQSATFDLVLSDFRMPGMDGVTLLTEIKRLQPETARMIISAYADFGTVVDAINQAGIERFISKPWHDAELKEAVRQTLERRDLLVENRRLADELRRMERALAHQRQELERLERENPGITQVHWAADGSILLDGAD